MDVEAKPESSSRKLMGSHRPPQSRRRSRRRCVCLSVTAVLLALGLLILILALTVFKPRRPTTTVSSVALDNLSVGFNIAPPQLLLNVSLDIAVSVHNPNRVGFRYHRGDAILRHRSNDIGDVPIPAGRIGARDTRGLNLTLSLMGDRILSDSALFSDVTAGVVPFEAYIKLSGKVRILFSIHVTTYSTCDLDIFIANQSISNLNCRYRTKL